jgi:hypothetical protein
MNAVLIITIAKTTMAPSFAVHFLIICASLQGQDVLSDFLFIIKQVFYSLKIKKMKTKKMSLANIQGKLSRTEMKSIMAGSYRPGECSPGGASCGPDTRSWRCCWSPAGYMCVRPLSSGACP